MRRKASFIVLSHAWNCPAQFERRKRVVLNARWLQARSLMETGSGNVEAQEASSR